MSLHLYVTIKSFHNLAYAVTKLLTQMQRIESIERRKIADFIGQKGKDVKSFESINKFQNIC